MDPLDYLFSLEKLGVKFGLRNIEVLCEALGHPERAYPSIIVAGTNGKGSVTAMLEQALRASGLRAARYTSPHLVRLNERFVIDGRAVTTGALREVAADVQALVAALRANGTLQAEPTFFEVTTAIGFELFRRARVDVAALEVGMGGRLDATRAAPASAAAITSIDFDHQRFLGDTLAAIAFEKAGVIRPGMPVVVGETKAEAVAVIADACRERAARYIQARDGVRAAVSMEQGVSRLELATPRRRYPPMELALRGRHQVANAVVAVRLLEELEGLRLPITAQAIVSGLTEVAWRGRLDLVQTSAGPVLFDGAHNPAGARVLADYLADVFPGGVPMVFGAMSDKDAGGILEVLLPHVTRLVVTRPDTPRAHPAGALAEVARRLCSGPVDVVEPTIAALDHARQFGSPVLVAGSIFLVGDLMAELGIVPA
ncbi:MAG: bifunctional folylpolyglutamate synthase/dihydrofolate synthase [Bacteroidales bacterium]